MTAGLKQRFFPPDSIQYVILAGERTPMTLNVAAALSDASLDLVNLLPKALGQCLNPIDWHRRYDSIRAFRPYNLGIAFDDIPEAFYYTNLGRSDLVQFTSWIDRSLRDNAEAKKIADEILAYGSL